MAGFLIFELLGRQHCLMSKENKTQIQKNVFGSILIFTKPLQNVYLIYVQVFMYCHARCNCKLQKVS